MTTSVLCSKTASTVTTSWAFWDVVEQKRLDAVMATWGPVASHVGGLRSKGRSHLLLPRRSRLCGQLRLSCSLESLGKQSIDIEFLLKMHLRGLKLRPLGERNRKRKWGPSWYNPVVCTLIYTQREKKPPQPKVVWLSLNAHVITSRHVPPHLEPVFLVLVLKAFHVKLCRRLLMTGFQWREPQTLTQQRA